MFFLISHSKIDVAFKISLLNNDFKSNINF
jgi:hypothetical protein